MPHVAMPRFRFTPRGMMLAVAIVAIYRVYAWEVHQVGYSFGPEEACAKGESPESRIAYSLRASAFLIVPPTLFACLYLAVHRGVRPPNPRRPIRYSLRGIMLGAALVALALGAEIALWRRSARFGELQTIHIRVAMGQSRCADDPFGSTSIEEHKEHHLAMFHKYMIAASHPWLPVTPDPPEPK